MKIIYVRMKNYDWVSVPSDAVARELEKLGHSITILDSINYIPPDNYDFVWSPYESVTPLGQAISKKVNIPHFAHIEVIPPWRYFSDADPENHGISKNDPEVSPEAFSDNKKHYEIVIHAWKSADIKTISSPVRLKYHQENFGTIKGKINIRFPSVDHKIIDIAKKMYSPEKSEKTLLTISRLVPVKRHDILVEVMNRVKTSCIWKVIGSGPSKNIIETSLKNSNVSLKISEGIWGWAKMYEMMKANLFIFSTGAMPPMEASLLGTSSIIMESQGNKYLPDFDKFQKHNYEDSLPIFEYGKYDEMAELIDSELNKPEPTILKDYDTVNKFMSGKTGITTSQKSAENIIKLMKNIV